MSAIEFRALRPEDVEVRVGTCRENGVSLLLYKTSRTDMALLDETVGPENWQTDYKTIDGKLFCGIGCRFGDGEWVWKWSNGTPSNMEAAKGEASDAMKRAGFMWGIGRELYTAPFIWVRSEECNVRIGKNGKPQCYDDFRVVELEVEGGAIVKLTVCNMSRKGRVVYGNVPKEQPSDELQAAYKRMGSAIVAWCERHGVTDQAEVQAKKDGVKKRPEWPDNCKSVEYIAAIAEEFETA